MLLTKNFTLTENYDKENRQFEFHHPSVFSHEPPQKQLFNTHQPWFFLPPGIFQKRNKLIVLIRNPIDLAVSVYHVTHSQPLVYHYHGSWDGYFSLFMQGKGGCQSRGILYIIVKERKMYLLIHNLDMLCIVQSPENIN